MQKIKKLLVMMLMMASVFFIACDDEGIEIVELSAEDAQVALNQASTSMAADFNSVNKEGIDAMAILMNLDDPFSSTKSIGKTSALHNIYDLVQSTKIEIKKTLTEVEPFDFSALTGTYEWHHSQQRWSVDPTSPTDAIVIKFPADSTNLDNNNAAVTISNYSEVLISVMGETPYYAPTSISYSLSIDEIKYLGIDLTAVWNSVLGEPTDYIQEIYVKPLSFRQEFENNATLSGIGYYIDNEDTDINLFSATLDAIYELGSMDDDPTEVSGTITYGDLKMDISINVKGIDEVTKSIEAGTLSDAEEIQTALNDEIDATVYYNGDFVADIELRYNPLAYIGVDPEDYDDVFPFYPVFVYSDATEEPALPFFINLVESLEDFFSEIEDYVDEFFG